MRILTQYVLIEFLKVFLLTLGGMTLIIFFFGIIDQAIKEGLGPSQLAQLAPYLLPEALRFAVPGTVLFAVCSLYGRMAGSNEVVAIKSLGISPLSIQWPVFALAFLLSLGTVWLNDLAVSWGRNGARQVVLEAIDEIVYGMLRSQRSYSSDKFAINVKRIEGRQLIQPTISFQSSVKSPAITIRAKSAELRADPGANVLVVSCREAMLEYEGGVSSFVDRFDQEIPLEDVRRKRDNNGAPSWMPLHQIKEQLPRHTAEIEQVEREAAVKGAFYLLTGDFAALSNEEFGTAQVVVRTMTRQWHRLRAEPHRRWSNGFSCLCFALIGAPMAMRLRNADFLTSFFMCFLPILILYYPLLMFFTDRAKDGGLPPYLVWTGNLVLALWGWVLGYRVWRY